MSLSPANTQQTDPRVRASAHDDLKILAKACLVTANLADSLMSRNMVASLYADGIGEALTEYFIGDPFTRTEVDCAGALVKAAFEEADVGPLVNRCGDLEVTYGEDLNSDDAVENQACMIRIRFEARSTKRRHCIEVPFGCNGARRL
jgi:hypothetical protein